MKPALSSFFRLPKPLAWLRIALFAAVTTLLAAFWYPDTFGSEPIYQDRTASDWLTVVGMDKEVMDG